MKDTATAYHACSTPDISRRTIRWTNQHFQTTILACLDVVRKMMILKMQKQTNGVRLQLMLRMPHH